MQKRGFTLIEVIVATAILTTAMAAALATYGAELRTLARARETAVAVELAEDRLAAIELFAMDHLPNLPDSLRDGRFLEPFEEYRWSAGAETVPGREIAQVTVSITWSTGSFEVVGMLPLPRSRRGNLR